MEINFVPAGSTARFDVSVVVGTVKYLNYYLKPDFISKYISNIYIYISSIGFYCLTNAQYVFVASISLWKLAIIQGDLSIAGRPSVNNSNWFRTDENADVMRLANLVWRLIFFFHRATKSRISNFFLHRCADR